MPNNIIKIDADFKSVTKGFDDLVNTVKGLGKQKFGINIDDKTLKAFGSNMQKTYKDLGRHNKELSKDINSLVAGMSKMTDEKKISAATRRLSDMSRQLKEGKNEAEKLARNLSSIGVPAGGRVGGVPRAGGMAGIFGRGGGGISLLMRGGIYGAALAGIAGIGTMIAGPAMRAAESRLRLRGLGLRAEQLGQITTTGAQFGFTPEETRGQAIQMMRGVGGIGGLGFAQLLSRGTGIGAEEITGMMSNLRQAGMRGREGARFLKDVFTEAVAAGFDSSRAADVMTSVAQYTAEMAQKGVSNASTINSLITDLMGTSDYFRQNVGRSMGALRGMDAMFQSANPFALYVTQRMAQQRQQSLSTGGLLFETQKSFAEMGPNEAKERLQETVRAAVQAATGGMNIVPGGGVRQLTEAQKEAAAGIARRQGLLQGNVTGIRELINAVLAGDQERIAKGVEAQVDLEKNTVDVLKSQENYLKQISASWDWFKEAWSTSILGMGKQYSDFTKSIGDSILGWFGFGPDKRTIAQDVGLVGGGAPQVIQEFFKTPSLGKGISAIQQSRLNVVEPMIDQASKAYGVPSHILKGVMLQESGFDPLAMSPTGATGLGQATQGTWNAINPDTGKPFGEGKVSGALGTFRTGQDPRRDPQKNINFTANYLKHLKNKHGTWHAAVKRYISPADVGWHDVNIMSAAKMFEQSEKIQVQQQKAIQGLSPQMQQMIFANPDATVSVGGVGGGQISEIMKFLTEKRANTPVIPQEGNTNLYGHDININPGGK